MDGQKSLWSWSFSSKCTVITVSNLGGGRKKRHNSPILNFISLQLLCMCIILIRPRRPRTAQQIEIYNYDRQVWREPGWMEGKVEVERALLGYKSPAAPPCSGMGKETAIHTDLRAVV